MDPDAVSFKRQISADKYPGRLFLNQHIIWSGGVSPLYFQFLNTMVLRKIMATWENTVSCCFPTSRENTEPKLTLYHLTLLSSITLHIWSYPSLTFSTSSSLYIQLHKLLFFFLAAKNLILHQGRAYHFFPIIFINWFN